MKPRILIAAAMLALLTACSSLGLVTPQTFEQRLAAGYLTVQTVAETATAAVKANKLSDADAKNVVQTSRAALQALGVAQQLRLEACLPPPMVTASPAACSAPAADAKLQATLAILSTLSAYLATKTGG